MVFLCFIVRCGYVSIVIWEGFVGFGIICKWNYRIFVLAFGFFGFTLCWWDSFVLSCSCSLVFSLFWGYFVVRIYRGLFFLFLMGICVVFIFRIMSNFGGGVKGLVLFFICKRFVL